MKAIIISDLGQHQSSNNKVYQKLCIQLEDRKQVNVCNFNDPLNVKTEIEVEKKGSFYNIIKVLEEKNAELENADEYVDIYQAKIELGMCFKLAIDSTQDLTKNNLKRLTKEFYETYQEIKKEMLL